MDTRYSTNPNDFKQYTTEKIRQEFLIQNLYVPDQIKVVYSHIDRMLVLGCCPVSQTISLAQAVDPTADLGTEYFLQRREIGIFNLGGSGVIQADETSYQMENCDCLYISANTRTVLFHSDDPNKPAKFYMISAPAHRPCQTKLIKLEDAAKRPLGGKSTSNQRVINQFIHPNVLETCQLTMGLTILEPGNVWNTMPAHTHERRMEIYTYFDLPEGQSVFHLMGQPEETRHIILKNEEAVISPSWSIHAGAGTSSYSFIWAMGGENQTFDDMDAVPTSSLK